MPGGKVEHVMIDVRYLVVLMGVTAVILLTRRKADWIGPITVGVAVAALLYALLQL